MSSVHLIERGMTNAEFARMNAGFDEHTREHGNLLGTSERYGFVLTDAGKFVGCSSGLVYKNGGVSNGWFYLTDLFVEKPYRKQGFGAELLQALEERVATLGVVHYWVITAGYEAPGFYENQGYTVFFEQEHYYATGHSRVMLRKNRTTDFNPWPTTGVLCGNPSPASGIRLVCDLRRCRASATILSS